MVQLSVWGCLCAAIAQKSHMPKLLGIRAGACCMLCCELQSSKFRWRTDDVCGAHVECLRRLVEVQDAVRGALHQRHKLLCKQTQRTVISAAPCAAQYEATVKANRQRRVVSKRLTLVLQACSSVCHTRDSPVAVPGVAVAGDLAAPLRVPLRRRVLPAPKEFPRSSVASDITRPSGDSRAQHSARRGLTASPPEPRHRTGCCSRLAAPPALHSMQA